MTLFTLLKTSAVLVLCVKSAVATGNHIWNLKKFTSFVTFGDSYTDESRLAYFIKSGGSPPPVGYIPPEVSSELPTVSGEPIFLVLRRVPNYLQLCSVHPNIRRSYFKICFTYITSAEKDDYNVLTDNTRAQILQLEDGPGSAMSTNIQAPPPIIMPPQAPSVPTTSPPATSPLSRALSPL